MAEIILWDCNLLIAICDEQHLAHRIAIEWHARNASARFATCPISQMSLFRYLIRTYPDQPISEAKKTLELVSATPQHEFWPDDIGCMVLPEQGIRKHAHVTDAYLVNLARSRNARIATMDQRMADIYAPTALLVR